MVLEALTGDKTPGQIAKQYGILPNSVGLWKKQFLERGPALFAEDDTVQEYEGRIGESGCSREFQLTGRDRRSTLA